MDSQQSGGSVLRDVYDAVTGRAQTERRATFDALAHAVGVLSARRVEMLGQGRIPLSRQLLAVERAVEDVDYACTEVERALAHRDEEASQPVASADLETRLQSVRDRLEGAGHAEPPEQEPLAADDEPSPAAGALMSVLDQVDAAFLSRPDGDPLLKSLRGRLVNGLTATGIEVIADSGRVDDERHEVVEVVDTDDGSKDETIGGTVRVGFAVGNRVLRAQQVVMLQAADSRGVEV